MGMIEEICSKLKEKREKLGYSLEYTVEKTKLYPSVIKDIEECNLTKINPTYLKGFLKLYASFLEVDLGNVLEEIDSLKQPGKKPKKTEKAQAFKAIERIAQMQKKIPLQVKKNILIVFVGLVFLGSLFMGSRLAVRKISRIFKAKPSVETTKKATPPLVIPDELTVSLTAKKKCFLKVVVDGKLLFEGILEKGVIETWKGNKEIEFRISDGSAVHLEVNGKALPTLTSIRKPIKSLKITPSGISVDK